RLAHFSRRDHRVLGRAMVSSGVAIGRVVAATNVTARQADAQVHPLPADLQTFFAALGRAMGRTRRVFGDMAARIREVGEVAGFHWRFDAVLERRSRHDSSSTSFASRPIAASHWAETWSR